MKKVVVIGGGLAGMTVSEKLSEQGYQVFLLEKNANLGGQCESVTVDGDDYDRFYHVFYTSDQHTFSLLKKLGLENDVVKLKPSSGFISKDSFYPLNGFFDFLNFPVLNKKEKFMLIKTLLSGMAIRDWRKLSNVTARDWVTQTGGESTYRKFWEPMLNTKFRDSVDDISAVDIWTRINRLSNFNPENKMCYLPGKLKRLINAYERKLLSKGVNILKNACVKKMEMTPKKVKGIVLDNNEFLPCDNSVICLPAPAASFLIPDSYSEYKKYLSTFNYIGNICLTFTSKKQLNTCYMSALGDINAPFTALMGLSNLYGTNAFSGKDVYYFSHYFSKDLTYFNASDDKIFQDFTEYFSKYSIFQKDDVENYFVSRLRYTEPIYTTNYKPPDIQTPIENLFLITGAQIYPKTPVINTTLNLAKQSSKLIIERIGAL